MSALAGKWEKRTIYKYDLQAVPKNGRVEFALEMPQGAELLTVEVQYGCPRLWAVVVPTATMERRGFTIIGTGVEFPADIFHKWVATWQEPPFVWHLFDRGRIA